MNAMSRCDLGEVSVCSTVHIGNRHDMGARSEGLEDRSCGGRARGKGKGIFGMLESCDSLFKVVPGEISIVCEDIKLQRSSPVGIRAASVLIETNGVANAGLGVGSRKGDLADYMSDPRSSNITKSHS